jgi:hypothetical protein
MGTLVDAACMKEPETGPVMEKSVGYGLSVPLGQGTTQWGKTTPLPMPKLGTMESPSYSLRWYANWLGDVAEKKERKLSYLKSPQP